MNLYYKIKWLIKDTYWDLRKRCQRFKRGYSWGDVWDMDIWFIETIKPMLIHLSTHGDSYPCEFKSRDEWCAILDEMIDCIELMDEDNVYAFLGFCEIDDYKRMTHEDIVHAHEIRMNNKNRFFELFSKHFYDLWD